MDALGLAVLIWFGVAVHPPWGQDGDVGNDLGAVLEIDEQPLSNLEGPSHQNL